MMFSNPLVVKQLPGYEWEVVTGFTYESKDGYKVEVPYGVKTDLASVPRALWWFISPAGKHSQACVVHDYMYDNAIDTKEKADEIFYEALRELGVPMMRAKVMYWGVKLFGRGKYAE